MAGAGYKLFNTGDVLTAAQVNTYLMEQTVMVFANAAARTTALSGVVSEGMISYLKDTNAVEVYDGSNWVSSDDPNAIQNTIVDAKGDLIAASAADTPARLAAGANDTLLIADSSQSTGLKWGGAWTTWTPTATNYVKGNGTEVARYAQIGKTVFFEYSFTFGSTSSMSGVPVFTLPVNYKGSLAFAPVGNAFFEDKDTAFYFGRAVIQSSNNWIVCYLDKTDGTYSRDGGASATIPFTWATNDRFMVCGTYEAN